MKKLVSLLLVLALLLGCVSVASAEDKKVTLRALGLHDPYLHDTKRTDLTPALEYLYEQIRHLVPGYEIEIEFMTYEDYAAQTPLLLAAGDIPDIFFSDGMKYQEYQNTGYFLEDLSALLESHGQDILANVSQGSWDIVTAGDTIPAIPSENFYYKFPTIIRTDWVEKLGFEVKGTYTLSEMKEIWAAMTTQDPDGNGVADTFGLGTRYNGRDWTQTFMPIIGAFGGAIDDVYVKDGEAYMFNYSDDFRAALVYMRDLYAAGLVDPECFVLNYDQAKLKAAQGKAGTFSGWWNVAGALFDTGLLKILPEARLGYIYITSDDGQTTGVANNGGVSKTIMISADCEYPELAMAVINYLNTWEGYRLAGDPAWVPAIGEDGLVVRELNPNYPDSSTIQYFEVAAIGSDFIKEANSTDEDARYTAGMRRSPFNNIAANMAVLNYGNEIGHGQSQESLDFMFENMNNPEVYTTERWQNTYHTYISTIGNKMQGNPNNHNVYTSIAASLPVPFEYLEYGAGLETNRTDWVVDFVTGAKDVTDDAQWAKYLQSAVDKGAQKLLDAYVAEYNTSAATPIEAAQIVK